MGTFRTVFVLVLNGLALSRSFALLRKNKGATTFEEANYLTRKHPVSHIQLYPSLSGSQVAQILTRQHDKSPLRRLISFRMESRIFCLSHVPLDVRHWTRVSVPCNEHIVHREKDNDCAENHNRPINEKG